MCYRTLIGERSFQDEMRPISRDHLMAALNGRTLADCQLVYKRCTNVVTTLKNKKVWPINHFQDPNNLQTETADLQSQTSLADQNGLDASALIKKQSLETK